MSKTSEFIDMYIDALILYYEYKKKKYNKLLEETKKIYYSNILEEIEIRLESLSSK